VFGRGGEWWHTGEGRQGVVVWVRGIDSLGLSEEGRRPLGDRWWGGGWGMFSRFAGVVGCNAPGRGMGLGDDEGVG